MKLDSDKNNDVSKRTINNIKEVMYMVRRRKDVLQLFERYESDGLVQDMLRNSNCFGICMKGKCSVV